MTKRPDWSAEKEEATKKLVRDAIRAVGADDPATIPHRVKERLKGQATGALDVDAYVKEVLAERKKRRM
jgi:hypothetical protein